MRCPVLSKDANQLVFSRRSPDPARRIPIRPHLIAFDGLDMNFGVQPESQPNPKAPLLLGLEAMASRLEAIADSLEAIAIGNKEKRNKKKVYYIVCDHRCCSHRSRRSPPNGAEGGAEGGEGLAPSGCECGDDAAEGGQCRRRCWRYRGLLRGGA